MSIDYAGKRGIHESGDLPDVSEGIQMFFQRIELELIRKQNDGGFLQEDADPISTQGVRITQTPQQLAMHPEGERDWKWSNLFMVPEPRLKVDDRVKIQGVKYRVMNRADNKEYGCMQYELLEDYDD